MLTDLFYPRKMCFFITPKPIPGLHVLFLLEPQSLISCVIGGSTCDLAKGLESTIKQYNYAKNPVVSDGLTYSQCLNVSIHT